MSDPIGTYTTGSDGTVTIEDLQPQTVYIQEISVPEHLILDSTIHSITITAGITSHYTPNQQLEARQNSSHKI